MGAVFCLSICLSFLVTQVNTHQYVDTKRTQINTILVLYVWLLFFLVETIFSTECHYISIIYSIIYYIDYYYYYYYLMINSTYLLDSFMYLFYNIYPNAQKGI